MGLWRFHILQTLSEQAGMHLPESIIDDGLSTEDPVDMARETLKKLRLKQPIDPIRLVDQLAEQLELLKKRNVKILTKNDSLWPIELNYLPQSPHLLYVLGEISCQKKIAMIGSREAPSRCLSAAKYLANMIAQCGYDIVSGGAIGCDIAAHRSLISASRGSNAVLILPGGLGSPYPLQNLGSFNYILEQGGCWISERPYFYKPSPRDFLIRNRIIVGISSGIVVIHGDERSGTSTTVRLAISQGKDIYVSSVGIEDSPLGQRLIAEGAEIVHP